jgi:glycosyltransferase involved in cell wall biosynthesis
VHASAMLRIGFDISGLDETFKEHAARGIGRYVGELQKYFAQQQSPAIEVASFSHADILKSSWLNGAIDRIPLGRRTLKQQMLFPLKMSMPGVLPYDVIHFPAHMDAPSWCWRKYIITVLDLIPLVLKDLYQAECPGLRFTVARWLEIKAIQNASLVLAISENTARDVNRILGVPNERIVVTPLGVSEHFFEFGKQDPESALRERYKIPIERPILLYVGGIDPRKNWKGMLEVLRGVLERVDQEHSPAPVLLMAGKISGDRQFPKLTSRIRELGLENDVLLPGYVPDDDLLQLCRISSVFLFLSLYEGFGLPPLEAMAAGAAVVCSKRSCLQELVGDGALTVDPENYREVIEAVLHLLSDSNTARGLAERGRSRAACFTWEKTGAATMAAYQRFVKRVDA